MGKDKKNSKKSGTPNNDSQKKQQERINKHVEDEISRFKCYSKTSKPQTSENIKHKIVDQVTKNQKNKKQELTNNNRNLFDVSSSSECSYSTKNNDYDDQKMDDFEILEEKVFRYEGSSLNYYKNPFKLKNEIDKYLNMPNAMIKKAFINNKNNQLYLITDDPHTCQYLSGYTWPKKAFINGIQKATNKEKITCIAIRGVDVSIDLEDDQFKNLMEKEYQIYDIKRIIKKSLNNKPLPILRAKVKQDTKAKELIKFGIRIGYSSYRIEEWKHEPKPLQCKKCNRFNHKSQDCEKETICPLCTGNHTLQECPKEKIECSNCGGNHPAFSKKCIMMIEKTKELTESKNVKPQKIFEKAQSSSLNDEQLQNKKDNIKNNRNEKNVNVNSILIMIISNLSTLISSKKLDMSSLVKINQAIENLTNLINE
ncbi:unnamed protein product [Brachionus calyciflorus]|uniref:Nucleic-acid-binding protein from transposon X-element n=1 Tax=Brachionus calyciflorus TaxID=104777 RepID=A0A814L4L3_9BILA|nr:unnamed protein product [Brachionus calyciflorus]